MSKINKKIKNLTKNFNFKQNETQEIKKMYLGEFFNTKDLGYLKLLKISKDLCEEYNNINKNLKQKISLFETIKIYFKKKKILNKLFPCHKAIGSIRQVDAVIGLVDLDNFVFLNQGTVFCKHTLCHIGSGTMFGVKVCVGDDQVEQKDNLIKLKRVDIQKNTWIGAGAKICNGTTLKNGCVVASGAVVKSDVEENFLAVGRPAKDYCKLDKSYSSKQKFHQSYTSGQIENIKKVIYSLGYKSVWKEYQKVLNGKKFNTCKIKFGNLFLLTHRLCAELGNPSTTNQRKQEIINLLFPNHGKNFVVENGIFMDLLGTIVAGDNVTIKSGTYLAGNVFIGNNVTLEQNSLIFASEHDMLPKERKMRFNLKNGLYRFTWTDTVIIEDNITLNQNCIIVPGTVVKQDVPADALCTNKKIIL